jgi:hypothetical protein
MDLEETEIRNYCAGEGQQQLTDGPTVKVEADSNIFNVALRVVGGHEKGTRCLGV